VIGIFFASLCAALGGNVEYSKYDMRLIKAEDQEALVKEIGGKTEEGLVNAEGEGVERSETEPPGLEVGGFAVSPMDSLCPGANAVETVMLTTGMTAKQLGEAQNRARHRLGALFGDTELRAEFREISQKITQETLKEIDIRYEL